MRLPKKGLIGLFAVLLLLGHQTPAQGINPWSTFEKAEKHPPVMFDDDDDNPKDPNKVMLILINVAILAIVAAKIYSRFHQDAQGSAGKDF